MQHKSDRVIEEVFDTIEEKNAGWSSA